MRVGSPLNLGQNSAVRDAVVIMADATIAGQVLGDVVVVLGNLRLEPTAVVEGEIVVVGGVATVVPGARLEHDFAVIGGALEAPPGFSPRGEHVMIGPPEFGQAMRDVTPWFTRGLLWGRVIVPGLPWVWTIVGIVLLLNVVIAAGVPGRGDRVRQHVGDAPAGDGRRRHAVAAAIRAHRDHSCDLRRRDHRDSVRVVRARHCVDVGQGERGAIRGFAGDPAGRSGQPWPGTCARC